VQRFLRKHEERARKREIVSFDKADESEHQNQYHVVRTERNTVKLSAEN